MAVQPPSWIYYNLQCIRNDLTEFHQILQVVAMSLWICSQTVLTCELDPKWRRAAILDLLKSLISPARLDRFLPNFAGRRIEAMDMFTMSFHL